MCSTSSLNPVVLWSTTEPANTAALQAGLDALSRLDTNAKRAGIDVGCPALPAHPIADGARDWKTMTLRGFDEVNGGGFNHPRVMVVRGFHDAPEVPLRLQPSQPPLMFFG